ncbi:unnamed protein product [Phytophthora fragariaefolia]|uniref:Unnamed protein product n=1 Tax=Phytophthora fragariaefolia TaxID=1490495 RepID=A0A9W6XMC7_9STRA|nr:unnamed protein product [Phytophthora fragariaefolia]
MEKKNTRTALNVFLAMASAQFDFFREYIMEREKLEEEIAGLASKLEQSLDFPSEDVLDHGLSLFDEVEAYLTRSVYDSNSGSKPDANIVLLGTAGAGKSTVVSFLFGEGKMLVRHETPFSRVLVSSKPLPGVAIRSGSDSVTLLPICNHARLGEEVIAAWDMPGSRETRGPFVELLVHFIYKWMLIDAKTLRFIIVSPPLHERPQISSLQNTINGSLIRAENAVLIYTKCSWDFDPDSTADLKIEESKRGIRSFALPTPVKSDPDGHDYTAQYDVEKCNILDALKQLSSDSVAFDDPLPDAAQQLLYKFRESSVAFARDKISKCFLKLYKWHAYRGALQDMKDTLGALKAIHKLSFDSVIVLISRLIPAKAGQVQTDSEIEKASRRLSHVGMLVGAEIRCRLTEWLNPECSLAVENTKEVLSTLIREITAYVRIDKNPSSLGTGVLIISAYQLHLSKVVLAIKNFVAKHLRCISSVRTIPVVVLVGFESVTVDSELVLWANVALASPVVRVTLNAPFDLSAVGRANSLLGANYTRGMDGSHGLPGLPGGNFAAICNKLEDNTEKLRATISCGQTGGSAQNGGDGVNGVDSSYSITQFERDVTSAIESGLLDNEKGSVNGLNIVTYNNRLSPLTGRFYGTQGLKEWTIIRESSLGTSGKRPGSGGIGGFGGQGGKLHIQVGTDVWRGSGATGQQGHNGASGQPSRDGRASPNFSALVHQWYFKGGLYKGTMSKPQVVLEKPTIKATPPLMYARPVNGEGASPVDNRALTLESVKHMSQLARNHLEAKFRQCDFSKMKYGWEPEVQAKVSN